MYAPICTLFPLNVLPEPGTVKLRLAFVVRSSEKSRHGSGEALQWRGTPFCWGIRATGIFELTFLGIGIANPREDVTQSRTDHSLNSSYALYEDLGNTMLHE